MIIRPAERGLHLITQPDHAALAGRIMEHWNELATHPRRDSILLAVAEHDNGWREPDAAPTLDAATGRVHDFINAPAAIRQDVWPRAVNRLSHEPWAAALVAQHAITVYDRYRNDDNWDAFFRRMEDARDALIADTPLPPEQLHADYPFVRIGDLISLIFCNKWREETYKKWTFVLDRDRDRVEISPDPFDGPDLPIEISAIELADRTFTSDEELRSALRSATRTTLRGVVAGTR